MPTAAQDRERRLLSDLRNALAAGEQFVVHYMPTIDLADGRVVGCEALVRWQHPGLGLVRPDQFVPLAERNGLVGDLGDQVRDLVADDLVAGRLPCDSVAVNVSGAELGDAAFPDRLLDALELRGVDPHAVTVEVTETALAVDLGRASESLLRLRAAGLRTAIDDFGTGHASLEYLVSLPCDIVKIDRRFVAGLGTDDRCTAVVQGVIGMAHGLGLVVVAEGVETSGQLDQLTTLACEQAQGYLIGRPVPATELSWDASGPDRRHDVVRRRGARDGTGRPSAQLLLDVTRDLEQCRDLHEAFDRMLAALRADVVFTGGSVQLAGPDGLRLAAAHPPPTPQALAARLPEGQGVGWAVISSGELRYLPDITSAATVPSRRRRASATRDTRSYLAVPLLLRGRAAGLVQLDSVDPDAFDERDQLLLAAYASSLASVVSSRGWAPNG